MRCLAALTLVACSACAPPSTPPAPSPLPPAPPTASSVAASPASADSHPAPPAPEPAEAPTTRACNETQTNTPCIQQTQRTCYLIRNNCTGLPCTAAAPEKIDCPADLPLPTTACARADACRGVSDEGCCVGCNHLLRTQIAAACATRIEAASDCDEVARLLDSPGCAR
jgi:hypothetical protein